MGAVYSLVCKKKKTRLQGQIYESNKTCTFSGVRYRSLMVGVRRDRDE